MPRRTLKERNIRTLVKIGKVSLGLILPREFINKLKWQRRQKVVVNLRGKSIIIRDWKN